MVFQIEKILQNNENSFPRFDLHLCFSMCNLKLRDVDVNVDVGNDDISVVFRCRQHCRLTICIELVELANSIR